MPDAAGATGSARSARVAPMSRTPLYRPEVLEARRNRWLGRIILRQPIAHWAMTWIAIGTAALAVAFLCSGEYARKVRIEGRLVDAVRADAMPVAAMRADAASPTEQSGNDGTTLEAHLAVPEALLASTRVGAEVLLRYPAFPHQHYGQYRGRIVRIARHPIAAASSTIAYRVTVALERQRVRDDHGEERDLQPGLGVQAEVVVEKRRLYEWLFEPFALLRERFQT